MTFVQAPADPTNFRPPLWSQESAYSATDDRRFIMATLSGDPRTRNSAGGVMGGHDLKVTPRYNPATDPWPNGTPMPGVAVDILPGLVSIAGTDRPDQGTYLCALDRRVTIDLTTLRPTAANQYRRVYIFAEVVEGTGQNPATWRLTARPTANGTTAANVPTFGVSGGQPWPKSSVLLSITGPIHQGTTNMDFNPTTSTGQITEMRHFGRPAPMGSTLMYDRYPNNVSQVPGFWAEVPGSMVQLFLPPEIQPFDVHYTWQGNFRSKHAGLSTAQFGAGASFGSPDWRPPWGGSRNTARAFHVNSLNSYDRKPFHLSFFASNLVLGMPAYVYVWAEMYNGVAWTDSALDDISCFCRITPAGGGLVF